MLVAVGKSLDVPEPSLGLSCCDDPAEMVGRKALIIDKRQRLSGLQLPSQQLGLKG